MTPTDYVRAKAAGMVTIIRLSEGLAAITCRGFDSVTGKELEPAMNQFNIEEVQRQADSAEAGLRMLQEFLADMRAAPLVQPVAPAPIRGG